MSIFSRYECVTSKMHSPCFGIMGGHGNFAFNLVVKLFVELGYVFLILSNGFSLFGTILSH
ncbi:unnamed protein product [Tenebrio molitor]|nr:unnamed protein product [Tenebrio molitor]